MLHPSATQQPSWAAWCTVPLALASLSFVVYAILTGSGFGRPPDPVRVPFHWAEYDGIELYMNTAQLFVGGYRVHGVSLTQTTDDKKPEWRSFAVDQECLCSCKGRSTGVFCTGANEFNAFSLVAAQETGGNWVAQQVSVGVEPSYSATFQFGGTPGGPHTAEGHTEARDPRRDDRTIFRAQQSAIGCTEGVGAGACQQLCGKFDLSWGQVRERCGLAEDDEENQRKAAEMAALEEEERLIRAERETKRAVLEAGRKALEEAMEKQGAVKTPSGLVVRMLVEGVGVAPRASDTVSVQYEGTLANGTVFDSTYAHNGKPATVDLSTAISGWTEGLMMMKIGGKASLTIPYDLAYNDLGFAQASIPPFSSLRYVVELLGTACEDYETEGTLCENSIYPPPFPPHPLPPPPASPLPEPPPPPPPLPEPPPPPPPLP